MSDRDAELYDRLDEPEPAPERTRTLRDTIDALRRRWWIVAAVFVLVLVVGIWRTLRQPRLYRAQTTVRIEPPQSALGDGGVGAVNYRVDPMVSEQEIIRSDRIAEDVAQRLGLRVWITAPAGLRRSQVLGEAHAEVDPEARNGSYLLQLRPDSYVLRAGRIRYDSARYGLPVRGPGFALTVPRRPDVDGDEIVVDIIAMRAAASEVRNGIATRVLPQTDIIEIAYIGQDPVYVRDIADAIALAYADYSRQNRSAELRMKSEQLAQALRDQHVALAAAQDSLRAFKQRYQTIDITAEQQALFEGIESLSNDRRSLAVERQVFEALVGRSEGSDFVDDELRRLVGTNAVAQNQYIASLYDRWLNLSERLEEMARGISGPRVGPGNPDYEAVAASIRRVKGELRLASAQYIKNLDTRIASLDQRIRDLRAQSATYPPLASRQLTLQADVATQQTLYDKLLADYQISRINESSEMGGVELIDQAALPMYAISPNRRRAAVYAAVLGLVLGVGLALLLDRLDDSIRSPDELVHRFDLPVLGLIPGIRRSDATEGTAPAAERLVTHADPRSPVAESYRSLRTNLAFARAHQDVRAIVLTSPGPADGKSTTAANLAITFAQQGQRTLLVDADMRRAVLDRTFGVPRSPGLTDVIIGTAALREAANESDVPNLFVLGSGQFPPNPSELLGSAAMRRVVEEAREAFDIVLFDSPPLLAVTDAAVLSTMVDGTMLIVRMHATAREAIRRALTQLRAVHGRVLGAVLNDVPQRAGSYYGGYGYYYYAYYGTGQNGNGGGHGLVGRLRALAGRRGSGVS